VNSVPPVIDTADLRSGPEINVALLSALALVGDWAGHGTGLTPDKTTDAGELSGGEEFRYAQRVSFVHDGRPFLAYTSRSWLLNPDGSVQRPAFRENGFLRVGPGPDDLELVLASAAGIVEVFHGIAGDQRWELATVALGFTPTAKQMAGERRLYAVSGQTLTYVQELAVQPGEYRPHLAARLSRDG